MSKVDGQLKDKDMGIELTQNAKDLIAELGYDPVLGARPLRRTIQREIEDPLSEKILFGEVRPGELVTVDKNTETGAQDGDNRFTFSSKKKESVPDDTSALESGNLPPAAPETTPPVEATG